MLREVLSPHRRSREQSGASSGGCGGKFRAGREKFRDWRGKLIERLRRKMLSARDIEVLLRPPRREHFPKVLVSYLSFPVWLAKYDHTMTRGLEVNLNSYRAQKKKHIEDVRKQLDISRGRRSPR